MLMFQNQLVVLVFVRIMRAELLFVKIEKKYFCGRYSTPLWSILLWSNVVESTFVVGIRPLCGRYKCGRKYFCGRYSTPLRSVQVIQEPVPITSPKPMWGCRVGRETPELPVSMFWFFILIRRFDVCEGNAGE